MSEPTPGDVVSRCADVAKWVIAETGKVGKDVVDAVDAKTYGADDYVGAMARLFSIGLAGALKVVEVTITSTALPGGPAGERVVESDPQDVDPVAADRELTVTQAFTRGGPDETIPLDRVTFVPPKLPANQTTFKVGVRAAGLPTGTYIGTIRIGAEVGGVERQVDVTL